MSSAEAGWPTLAVFHPANDAGQQLLDEHIRPVCRRQHIRVVPMRADANRGAALATQLYPFVLWDCSVEPPATNVYRALIMQAKVKPKNLVVSRTPLPRNIVALNQCAPIHGDTFDNAFLAQWLERKLHRARHGGVTPPDPNFVGRYWMFDEPAGVFLSFRGSHQAEAEAWRKAYEAKHGTTLRMVPANEFSYPFEVVTSQQMWEGAARLMHEIVATGRAIILGTADYLQSFWTSTELMLVLWLLYSRDRRKPEQHVRDAAWAFDLRRPDTVPFREGIDSLGLPMLTQAHLDRLVALINNADPITTAPESRYPPGRLMKLVVPYLRRRFGFYQPEFLTDSYWHRVRVPCPHCVPRRRARDVDWTAHMTLPPDEGLDYFGYFGAEQNDLRSGSVPCPSCGRRLKVVSRREPRTLWVPVMTEEKDQDRAVIEENPVWEVVT